MSHSRIPKNEDNSKTAEEINDQDEVLKKYKESLANALKRQSELEKKIKTDTLSFNKERKAYMDERTKLLDYIKNVDFKNGQLTTYSEQLDINYLAAQKKNKDLTDACQQLESELMKANEKIKSLTDALQQNQQTASSTVENKASSTTANHPAPAVTKPATEKEATIETAATAGTSSYSMFSPWKIFGYTDTKATPTSENPAHTSLADLTKASIEQALAETNAAPGMRK